MSLTMTAPTTSPIEQRSAVAEYLQQICGIRHAGIGAIFRQGAILNEAKTRLEHGAWQDLVRQLPFSLHSAHRVRQIAKNPTLANSATWADLPDGPAILYVFARLEGNVIRAAITAGRVHPRITLAQARALAGGAPAVKKAGTVECVIQQIARLCTSVPPADQPRLAARLRALADRLHDQPLPPGTPADLPGVPPNADPRRINPPEPGFMTAVFRCVPCGRTVPEDEVIEVRECPRCKGRFANTRATEGRCPACRLRPFSYVVIERGCPDCLTEVIGTDDVLGLRRRGCEVLQPVEAPA